MKKIAILLLVMSLGLVALATYVALGPFLTLNGIKNSFQNEDIEDLSQYVDFPVLRENIKSQLNARLVKKPTNSWRAMAASWGAALAERMVEGLVTPAGLESLLSGQHLQTDDEQTPEDNDVLGALGDAEFSFYSHDTCYVYISMQGDQKVQVTLKRDGLTWQLTNVELGR